VGEVASDHAVESLVTERYEVAIAEMAPPVRPAEIGLVENFISFETSAVLG
jgi:hypothetical protein